MKAMHRLMMTSQLYQMASDDKMADAAYRSREPVLLAECRASAWRPKSFGMRFWLLPALSTQNSAAPTVLPYIAPDIVQGSSHRVWDGKADDDPSTWRRSLYVFSKRSIRYPLFEAYDQPNLDQHLRSP
jgi:hypothetical protein